MFIFLNLKFGVRMVLELGLFMEGLRLKLFLLLWWNRIFVWFVKILWVLGFLKVCLFLLLVDMVKFVKLMVLMMMSSGMFWIFIKMCCFGVRIWFWYVLMKILVSLFLLYGVCVFLLGDVNLILRLS